MVLVLRTRLHPSSLGLAVLIVALIVRPGARSVAVVGKATAALHFVFLRGPSRCAFLGPHPVTANARDDQSEHDRRGSPSHRGLVISDVILQTGSVGRRARP